MRKIGRTLYYLLPASLRYKARWLFFLPLDIWKGIFGQKHPLVPPRRLIYTGGGDYLGIAQYHFDLMIRYTDISADSKVLDIGSGLGRMAVPFTSFLGQNGSYQGFDVVETGVRWAQKNISSKYPNFQFQFIPLKNDLYRKVGEEAAQFSFPFSNDHFDLAFLISVFTHMIADEIEHYLKEINRTLQVGGHCYATFFILNEKSRKAQSDAFNFLYKKGNYYTMDDKVESANVALEETVLHKMAQNAGLNIKVMEYGSWSGAHPKSGYNFQDLVVFQKVNQLKLGY